MTALQCVLFFVLGVLLGFAFGRNNSEEAEIDIPVYDEEELHTNCTVQVLHNSVTDEYSIGWWENESEAEL